MSENLPGDRKRSRPHQNTPEERYELSGDFRGAVINIKSTLVGAADIRDIENLPPEPGDSPFLGLQHFGEQDAGRFFGREQLTARIVGRLRRTDFLAIIGASGSGKSSIARAGVIPALRSGAPLADGALPPKNSPQWAIHVFTPTAHPIEALAAVLTSHTGSLTAMSTLQSELNENPKALSFATRQLLAQQSRPRLFLVIDQFEELYTLCRSDEERQAFIENLLNAVDPDNQQPLSVLITLRADFYAHIARHDRLREVISQHQEFIGAMSKDELVSAIDRPLAQGNWKIQEGLIEVILDDIGYEPGALPLLSHALLETWRRRRGRTLTLSAYTESGGISGAIAKTAETVFRQSLSPEQQPIARMIFLRMAELGEDIQATRRRASFDELITRSTDEFVIAAVIDILVDARLVTTGLTKPEETKIVELAHESLIREWPTLRQWLEEDREGLILHRQLTDATNDWIKFGKDPGMLFRGARLQQVLAWSQDHDDVLSVSEQEFLEESQRIAREEAEKARRLARATRIQRSLVAASLVLILVVSGLVYNFVVRQEPARMDALFNIAIAQFSQADPAPDAPSIPVVEEQSMRNALYQTLQQQLQDNQNLLVWTDGPELRDENVTIGAINPSGPQRDVQSLQALASRINADMIIFGQIEATSAAPQLQLSFWLAPREGFYYQDILGTYQLGDPIDIDNVQVPQIQDEINSQASATAWIGLGLTEAQLGHSLEALEAFLNAERFLPDSDVVQFLIGREYLFLVDRESVLEFAREDFEQQAEMAFQRAIQLNPENLRAHTGLAGVYFKRSQRLVADFEPVTAESSSVPPAARQAFDLIDQTITVYRQAINTRNPVNPSGLPEEQIAELGLGHAHLLKGELHQKLSQYEQARQQYDRAVEMLQSALPALQSPELKRYLTQAYEYLGSAHQGKAYVQWINGQYADSLNTLNTAVDYFEACIAQGEDSSDLIILNEIIAEICRPRLSEVNRFIDELNGAQG